MTRRIIRRLVAALLLPVVFLLGGCDGNGGKPAFQLTDLTGADFGRSFQLTDHLGKPRTLEDFKGKVVVLFFGYIFCPDVCPTTMGELALVIGRRAQAGARTGGEHHARIDRTHRLKRQAAAAMKSDDF